MYHVAKKGRKTGEENQ